MTDYSSYALFITWAIVGVLVIIYALKGFSEGTKKSFFKLLKFLVFLGLFLWITSMISIRIFTNNQLVGFFDNFLSLDDSVKSKILGDEVFPYIVAVLDVLFKVIFFLVIYIVVGLITSISAVSNFFSGKEAKANKERLTRDSSKYVLNNKRFVFKKRRKSSFLTRLGGGLIGATKGFIVALALLLPIVSVVSFAGEIETPRSSNVTQGSQLSKEHVLAAAEITNTLNKHGLNQIISKVSISDTPFAEVYFDSIFSSEIKHKNRSAEEFKVSSEIKANKKLVEAIYKVYSNNPDLKKIGKKDLANIETVLDEFENSKLAQVGVLIGYSLYKDELTKLNLSQESLLILDEIASSDLTLETDSIYKALSSIFEVGNIEELIRIATEQDYSKATIENIKHVSNTLKAVSEMNILSGAYVGLDYALNTSLARNLVTWENDSLAIRTYFDDILSNPDFFKGEAGQKIVRQFSEMADIVAENQENYDNFKQVVKNPSAYRQYLDTDVAKLLNSLAEVAVENKLITNSVEFGIDYAAFSLLKLDPEKLDEKLSNVLTNEHDWKAELANVKKGYLAAHKIYTDNPELTLIGKKDLESIKDGLEVYEDSKAAQVGLVLGYSLYKNQLLSRFNLSNESVVILDEIVSSDLTKETDHAYDALSSIFEIGNVGELIKIARDRDYSKATLENIEHVSDALKAASNSEIISGAYVAVDYLLNTSFANNLVTWEHDSLALRNYFDDILSDPNFFKGEAGKTILNNFAQMADRVTQDQASYDNFKKVVKNARNIKQYLDEDVAKLLDDLADLAVDNKLVTNSVEFGVDFAAFRVLRLNPNDLEGKFSDILTNQHNWKLELENVKKAYLSLSKYTADGAFDGLNYYQMLDAIFDKPTGADDLKEASDSVLGDDKAATLVLDKFAEPLINRLISNLRLRNMILDIVDVHSPLDYKIEVSKAINSLNVIHGELTIHDLMTIKSSEQANELLAAILKLVNANEADGVDDLDRFLDSDLVVYAIAKILQSGDVKQRVAEVGGFDAIELDLQGAELKGAYLSRGEVGAFIRGLYEIGVQDLDTIGFDMNTLKSLSVTQIDQILDSTFVYQIIDLSLKENFDIPEGAIETSARYASYITKAEIKLFIEAFEASGADMNGNANPENMTITEFTNLVAINSIIVNRLISKGIENAGLATDLSYVDASRKDIKAHEIDKLVETLQALEANGIDTMGKLASIELENLQALDDDTNKLLFESEGADETAKATILYYLTNQILRDTVGETVIASLPEDDFVDGNRANRFTREALVRYIRTYQLLIQP